jgi:hemolysin D
MPNLLSQSSAILETDQLLDSVIEEDKNKSDWSHSTQEIIDSLPQVWTRGLLYFFLFFASIILPWSMLSKLDETGTSRGRLEPQQGTFKLESQVAGKITAISVKEGDAVKAGQILVELETDLVRSEMQELRSRLEGSKNRLTQLELVKNQLELELTTQIRSNQDKESEKLNQVSQAEQHFNSLKQAFSLQESEKQAQVNQAQQNLDSLKRNFAVQEQEKIAQINQVIPVIKSKKAAYQEAQINLEEAQIKVKEHKEACELGSISRNQCDDENKAVKVYEQRLQQAEFEITQTESQLKENQENYQRIMNQNQAEINQAELRLKEQQSNAQKTIQQIQSDIQQSELRFQEQQKNHRSLLGSGDLALIAIKKQIEELESQLTTIRSEINQTQKQIQSQEIQLNQRVIKATKTGKIFNLTSKSIGSFFQPGELITEVVQNQSRLIFKAQILTSESGFLKIGQKVKIKFDSYPVQDYGVIEGTLIKKSPNSKVTETTQGQIYTFDLEISLDQNCINVEQGCEPLKLGETGQAEIIIRQRRLIDYIIDPFKKLQKEGLQF